MKTRSLTRLAVLVALSGFFFGSLFSAKSYAQEENLEDVNAQPVSAARVSITNFAFVPPKVTIAPGGTVTWTNGDTVHHTSTSDIGGWDSGHITTGQSYTLRFSAPGTYNYHCTVHPGMKGTVVVQ